MPEAEEKIVSGAEIVRAYRERGEQTRKEFCAARGVSLGMLDYYLRCANKAVREAAGKAEGGGRLLPVRVSRGEQEAGGIGSGVTVVLQGGLRLELGADFSGEVLRRAVEALRGS